MIAERAKPDAFCTTELVWRHGEANETVVTEAYWGPEEYSSVGPFFSCAFDWSLYEGSQLTLVVRTWKTRSGDPDEDAFRDYATLSVHQSRDGGRTWSLTSSVCLGRCVANRR